jgi:DNA-binding transcriptional LysR family regulator
LTGQRPHLRIQVRGTVASNGGDVVLDDDTLAPADLYAYYPSRQQLTAKVRGFINFLRQHLAPGSS